MIEYQRVYPGNHEPLDRVDVSGPVCDAAAAFARLPAVGRDFEFDTGGWFPDMHARANGNAGVHIGGVERKGANLLISARDCGGTAALIVASLIADPSGQPAGGRIEQVFSLDPQHAFAGGMQRIGNLLAVPLEGANVDACVLFLQIGNPLEPRVVASATIVRGNARACAAAITTLPDKRMLLGVIGEQKRYIGLFGARPVLDMYLSRTDDISDGFGDPLTLMLPPRAWYAAINFTGAVADVGLVRVGMVGLRAGPVVDFFQLQIVTPPSVRYWPTAGAATFITAPVGKRLALHSASIGRISGGIAVNDDGDIAVYAASGPIADRRLRISVFCHRA